MTKDTIDLDMLIVGFGSAGYALTSMHVKDYIQTCQTIGRHLDVSGGCQAMMIDEKSC